MAGTVRGRRSVRVRLLRAFVVVAVVASGVALAVGPAWAPSTVQIGNGLQLANGTYLNAQRVANNLVLTSVTVVAAGEIDIVDPIDLSTSPNGTPHFNLTLVSTVCNIAHDINMAAAGNLNLTGCGTVNWNGRITSGGTLIGPARVPSAATQVSVQSNAADLQQALDSSSHTSPVSVQVSPGQYAENLTLDHAVTLSGNDGSAVAGADPSAPSLSGTTAGDNVITVTASNVTVDGFLLDGTVNGGTSPASVDGVYGSGVDGLTVRHNTLYGFSGPGIDAPGVTNLVSDANVILPTAITSADHGTFTQGAAGSFTVMSAATPAAALTETGALPSGVTFTDNGDGTATLGGTPGPGSVGTYPLSLQATNGFDTPAVQAFTLTVSAGVPGPPTGLVATPGDGVASVAFVAPTDDGGSAVTGYDVTCVSPDGGTTGTGSAAASPVNVTGLTNGNMYTCIGTASNVNGPGLASTPSNPFEPTSCSSGMCVSVGDRTIYEGDAGTHVMNFPVTLSKAATSTVTVNYTVVGDTTPGLSATGGTKQTGGVDFKLKSGTLTFTTNTTSGFTPIAKTVAVTVYGDTSIESDETFAIILSNPSGGGVVLGRSTGTGTIRNDDGNAAAITLGVGDTSIVKTTSGAQNLTLPVTLSTKATSTVTVTYTIAPGSAAYSAKKTGGGDFGGKATGTLTFNVGTTGFTPNVKTLSIPIWPDANADTNETFTITLSNLTGTGVSLINTTATATILAS